MEFLLISSFVSPSPPPVAASGLENANEALTVVLSVLSKPDPKKLTEPEDNIDNDCTETFDEAPPPTKYCTVKVVLSRKRRTATSWRRRTASQRRTSRGGGRGERSIRN